MKPISYNFVVKLAELVFGIVNKLLFLQTWRKLDETFLQCFSEH